METITLPVAAPMEVPECYICMEPETAEMPFLTKQMCPCTSKADSSLKVHQLCLELSRDSTGKCNVCKKPLSGDWAFDASFFQKRSIYSSTRHFEQRTDGTPNGIYFTLKSTGAYHGPMRWLAAKGLHKDGKLHGTQMTFVQGGEAATERNYHEGVLHGILVERDALGKVLLQENYEAGKLHGLRQELYKDIQLTGQYEHGVKVGEHLEADKVGDSYGVVFTRHISRATYKAGVLNGPYLQFHIDAGEGLPSETAVYRDGKLNGLQEKWYVDTTKLEREQLLEAHWVDGLRNGRYATFAAGKLDHEAWYYMDKAHGLERTFFPDGKLMKELTWHMSTKHGRVREWTSGGRVLMDAAYDNGFRHGRFVSQHLRGYNSVTVTEDFWSNGTKELRHGLHRVKEGSLVTREVNYKMGVRHGISLKHDHYDNGYIFRYRDGKLHGKCTVICNDQVQAEGCFSNGVPVGKHQLFCNGALKESVSYDSEGRLHGKCTFNQTDGTPFQAFNYEHGVLHGRQVVYFAGTQREKRVFNMRRGHVHGRFCVYDERGAAIEELLLKEDEGVTLQECLGKNALCAPSEREADGTYAHRFMNAEGTIFTCPNAAASLDCNCEECYVPPAREPRDYDDDYCGCALCCGDDDDWEPLRDQTSYRDDLSYQEDDDDEYRRDRYNDY
jgi:antitoxin component YwqK of YwqJK toxin-antitoxin module